MVSDQDTDKVCSRCEKNPADCLHSCPYQSDINDNEDPEYCDCCQNCTYECAMDI